MLFTDKHLKNIIMEALEKDLQFKVRPIKEATDPDAIIDPSKLSLEEFVKWHNKHGEADVVAASDGRPYSEDDIIWVSSDHAATSEQSIWHGVKDPDKIPTVDPATKEPYWYDLNYNPYEFGDDVTAKERYRMAKWRGRIKTSEEMRQVQQRAIQRYQASLARSTSAIARELGMTLDEPADIPKSLVKPEDDLHYHHEETGIRRTYKNFEDPRKMSLEEWAEKNGYERTRPEPARTQRVYIEPHTQDPFGEGYGWQDRVIAAKPAGWKGPSSDDLLKPRGRGFLDRTHTDMSLEHIKKEDEKIFKKALKRWSKGFRQDLVNPTPDPDSPLYGAEETQYHKEAVRSGKPLKTNFTESEKQKIFKILYDDGHLDDIKSRVEEKIREKRVDAYRLGERAVAGHPTRDKKFRQRAVWAIAHEILEENQVIGALVRGPEYKPPWLGRGGKINIPTPPGSWLDKDHPLYHRHSNYLDKRHKNIAMASASPKGKAMARAMGTLYLNILETQRVYPKLTIKNMYYVYLSPDLSRVQKSRIKDDLIEDIFKARYPDEAGQPGWKETAKKTGMWKECEGILKDFRKLHKHWGAFDANIDELARINEERVKKGKPPQGVKEIPESKPKTWYRKQGFDPDTIYDQDKLVNELTGWIEGMYEEVLHVEGAAARLASDKDVIKDKKHLRLVNNSRVKMETSLAQWNIAEMTGDKAGMEAAEASFKKASSKIPVVGKLFIGGILFDQAFNAAIKGYKGSKPGMEGLYSWLKADASDPEGASYLVASIMPGIGDVLGVKDLAPLLGEVFFPTWEQQVSDLTKRAKEGRLNKREQEAIDAIKAEGEYESDWWDLFSTGAGSKSEDLKAIEKLAARSGQPLKRTTLGGYEGVEGAPVGALAGKSPTAVQSRPGVGEMPAAAGPQTKHKERYDKARKARIAKAMAEKKDARGKAIRKALYDPLGPLPGTPGNPLPAGTPWPSAEWRMQQWKLRNSPKYKEMMGRAKREQEAR